MRRYLTIYRAFFKNSLIREMQFRSHFWIFVVVNLIWAGMAMITFRFIFNQTNQVGGWTFPAILVLTATYYLFDRIFQLLFEVNFYRINYLVNSGDLDLILTKPVSGQFFISLRQVSLPHLFVILPLLITLIWLIKIYFWPIALINILAYGFLLLCGLVIVYSFWFMTLTAVFWLGNIENIVYLFGSVYEVSRIPADVTGLVLRPLLTYFLPLAFVATVPTQVLTGQINFGLVVFGVLAAAFWLWVSRLVWQLALRHYSSASS